MKQQLIFLLSFVLNYNQDFTSVLESGKLIIL